MPLLLSGISTREARRRAMAALEQVHLGEWTKHRPAQLSGGQRQRVTIARALVNDPAIVWADEPTGDLDERTGGELQSLLRRMHENHQLTSLIATHNLRLAESCDRVLRLEGGGVHLA